MSKFVGKSQAYILGYHNAMRDIQAEVAKLQVAAEKLHKKSKPTIFGCPSAHHNIAMGKSRAARLLNRIIMDWASEAFDAARGKNT